MKTTWRSLVAALLVVSCSSARAASALVLQSDFGTKDGNVATMKGVAYSVDPKLHIFDLTHEIPRFDVWRAAYLLRETAPYWPPGTVFVSVVDPGVGVGLGAVVLKTKTGHYFASPDNGSLMFVAKDLGIEEVREIDEANHRPGSDKAHVFYGRDVYAYVGAKLAAGQLDFDQVGARKEPAVVSVAHQDPEIQGDAVVGNIPALNGRFGNVWTNIDAKTFAHLHANIGDLLRVTITNNGKTVYVGKIPYANSFGDVPVGQPLAYLNNLMNLSFALNRHSFSKAHEISSGPEWNVKVERAK